MLNDIKEQAQIIENLANSYLPKEKPVENIKFNLTDEQIKTINNIYIVASGSSRNVGNIARYYIEKTLKIPTIVDYASEFAHRHPAIKQNDLVIAISQSGETADTYAALKIAKEAGAFTYALTNNSESRIHKLADSKMEVNAGKEISIPATKSFTAQLVNIYILTIYMAEKRGNLSSEKMIKLKNSIHSLPSKIEDIINKSSQLNIAAEKITHVKNLTIIGRSSNHAAAQEGALKIKETSYIDANGFPSGEFLHGYVAVVDENAPLISILLPEFDEPSTLKLAIKNTEDIKRKRDADLIIIKNINNKDIEDNSLFKKANFINIPESNEDIYPLLVIVNLQLLSYKIAILLKRDINNPRGLTKALEIE